MVFLSFLSVVSETPTGFLVLVSGSGGGEEGRWMLACGGKTSGSRGSSGGGEEG